MNKVLDFLTLYEQCLGGSLGYQHGKMCFVFANSNGGKYDNWTPSFGLETCQGSFSCKTIFTALSKYVGHQKSVTAFEDFSMSTSDQLT